MIIAVLSIFTALTAVFYSFLAIKHTKKQIAEMMAALADIKQGNGNRRILAKNHEIIAPVAYEINAIVRAYEDRLAAIRQTEEADKQLMTSLSHDIRTPLTTLIGYLDAAHKGIVTGKERSSYIETARHKAYDLKEYIDMLFDWFKLNSNEFALQINPVEIVEATRTILIDWIPVLEERQITYSIEILEQPFWVDLDIDSYARILNNLMQNAVIHSYATNIEMFLVKQDENIAVTISDNGIGIEKENLELIFQRLYKCDRGRSEKGSGLGLSIVQQLAQRMKGRVTAESTPGKGASFTVYFPLHKSEACGIRE